MSSKAASKLLVRTGRLQRPITGPRRFRKVKPEIQVKNWKIVRGDNVRTVQYVAIRLSNFVPCFAVFPVVYFKIVLLHHRIEYLGVIHQFFDDQIY